MELAHVILEYLKVLLWPTVAAIALIRYRDVLGSLAARSKLKPSLYGQEVETSFADFERRLTAAVGGALSNDQWDLLEAIYQARTNGVSVREKKYSMNMSGDLQWIRPIRNAGLIMTLPDNRYIEEAETLHLTPLGQLLMAARSGKSVPVLAGAPAGHALPKPGGTTHE